MEYQQTPPPPPRVEYVDDIPVRPKSWFLESILATLFCCLPFGIVGIVNAVRVNSLYDQTLYEESKRVSANAKRWTLIAFGFGIVYLIIAIIILSIGSFSEMNLTTPGSDPLYF